jgi:deazaflavin-dependent oxidoreductase (nitroreductase family)
MATTDARKALRKFKFERQVGRTIVNPLVGALDRVGIRASSTVELETVGAKTGQPRRVPLTGRADDSGVWVISQHGKRAGWAHNITANPTVRVRVDNEWRNGTATFEPEDDVAARARSFGGKGKLSQTATALGMRALQSDPISVRITFID